MPIAATPGAEPELLDDPRGEVLDDDVGRPDEPFQQPAPVGSGEVDREVTLC
jgi:hypothetical protein